MKMAFKNNNSIVRFFILGTVILITAACNFPLTINRVKSTKDAASSNDSISSAIQNQNSGLQCLAGIIPGETNRDNVIAQMGEPLRSELDGTSETIYYASANPIENNMISLEDSTVVWVSVTAERDDQTDWEAIQSTYGEPEHIAYSYYSQLSHTYAYPSQGLIFVVDDQTNSVLRMDCFVPLSMEDYMQKYGQYLPVENPFVE